ncbi:hypothetical protein VPHK394_0059 [Vibrio phage K394]
MSPEERKLVKANVVKTAKSLCINGLLNQLLYLTFAIEDKETHPTDRVEMVYLKKAIVKEIKSRNTEPKTVTRICPDLHSR